MLHQIIFMKGQEFCVGTFQTKQNYNYYYTGIFRKNQGRA
jgi:hypothetical protein